MWLSTKKKKIGFTEVELQSHTFETTKWVALYILKINTNCLTITFEIEDFNKQLKVSLEKERIVYVRTQVWYSKYFLYKKFSMFTSLAKSPISTEKNNLLSQKYSYGS